MVIEGDKTIIPSIKGGSVFLLGYLSIRKCSLVYQGAHFLAELRNCLHLSDELLEDHREVQDIIKHDRLQNRYVVSDSYVEFVITHAQSSAVSVF